MNTAAVRVPYNDSYYRDQPGLLNSWAFDIDNIKSFHTGQHYFDSMCGSCCICFPLGIVICPCYQMGMFLLCGKPNIEDLANAQHVCLTQDGVIYTIEKHKSGCRCYCCDVGKATHLLSYEKITDVSVEEPAGANWCGLVPKILYTVTIHTAGMPIRIEGLAEANNFKAEVMRIKREKEQQPMMDMMRMMQMQNQNPNGMMMPQTMMQMQNPNGMMMPQTMMPMQMQMPMQMPMANAQVVYASLAQQGQPDKV